MYHLTAIIISMILAGSTFVVAKELTSIPPLLVSGLSFLIAFLPFSIYTFLKEGIKRIDRKNLFLIFLQAFLGAFIVRFTINYGVNYTSAIEAGIISSTIPAVTLLLSRIILKEKLNKNQILGIFLILVGTIFINLRSVNKDSSESLNIYGNMILLFGVFCSSFFIILGKKVDNKISSYTKTTYMLFFSSILFIPFMVFELTRFNLTLIELTHWLYIIYYGIIGTALAYFLWFIGLSKIKGNIAGALMGIMPLSSTILSLIFLKELLTTKIFIGFIFILIGIITTTHIKKTTVKPAV